jgi:prepilin-type processing-associated H-X9-DG protein
MNANGGSVYSSHPKPDGIQGATTDDPSIPVTISIRDIPVPSSTIVLAPFPLEVNTLAGPQGTGISCGLWCYDFGSGLLEKTKKTGLHHPFRFNFLFADSHVKNHDVRKTAVDYTSGEASPGMWTRADD